MQKLHDKIDQLTALVIQQQASVLASQAAATKVK
jgi:hypothetical protein